MHVKHFKSEKLFFRKLVIESHNAANFKRLLGLAGCYETQEFSKLLNVIQEVV